MKDLLQKTLKKDSPFENAPKIAAELNARTSNKICPKTISNILKDSGYFVRVVKKQIHVTINQKIAFIQYISHFGNFSAITGHNSIAHIWDELKHYLQRYKIPNKNDLKNIFQEEQQKIEGNVN